ncbi:STAS domain-containing protein, partial [Plesiocystis pacifica]|uniref:STAS domain-containing protein n=1 Tax=Plesiocystis pacifica TaxID=191768 RepID=UPI000314E6D4
MGCESQCVLESEAGAALELGALLRQVRRCRGCPHADSEDPLVASLVARLAESARALRRLEAERRKLAQEREEALDEAKRYYDRMDKLERLQRVSSEEIEAALLEERERVRAQEGEIAALSAPLITISPGVIALPIVGSLGETRARILTERLLEEVSRARVRVPIIDLTGVREIDAVSVEHLLRMVGALRLLGARPVLTGVTPTLARAFTGLGVDLGEVVTLRSVQQALER